MLLDVMHSLPFALLVTFAAGHSWLDCSDVDTATGACNGRPRNWYVPRSPARGPLLMLLTHRLCKGRPYRAACALAPSLISRLRR